MSFKQFEEVMRVVSKQVNIFAQNVEREALEQFHSAMEQDFVVSGALMPDTHTGYSLPIGAVVATKDVIVPAWVGYDIGCGMCAFKLEGVASGQIRNNQNEIFRVIYSNIPMGFQVNSKPIPYNVTGLSSAGQSIAIKKKYQRASGSLGSGNHFMEIGEDEIGGVWIIIHSGSRGVGHGIATHYMKSASPDGKCREGHHGFDTDTDLGRDYIRDLDWCLEYALYNRLVLLQKMVDIVIDVIGGYPLTVEHEQYINRNHNHAEQKDGLWIHRKGATHAERGMMGVIPGNMKDGSFIVRGKGNSESLCSSSHGAGRRMSRTKAKDHLSMEGFRLDMMGITALVDESTLDESRGAYKDIYQVMDLQEDLVDMVHHVTPIVNIKAKGRERRRRQ
jgi:tRNA-splicing ligase RtcB